MKLNIGIFVAVGAVAAMTDLTARATDRHIVAFNQDATEMCARLSDDEVSREGIRKFFKRMSRGGLTHYLVNPNCHNTFFPSKTWNPVWHEDARLEPSLPPYMRRAKMFYDRGIDWVGELFALCREEGISPWLSMRMNDVHSLGQNLQWATSSEYVDHPEYSRACGDSKARSCDRGWDYGRPEVRARALALAREMLEKWDVDGFECDWMRYHRHVTDAAEKDGSGRSALTAFMREIRKLADEIGRQRGKKILVGVRVASQPEAALGLGTDPFEWAKEGLVDWVVPCNAWLCDDFRLPFGEWKQRLTAANPAVTLLGSMDFGGLERERWVEPQMMNKAEFYGYMERMYAAGVKDFYAFNLFIRQQRPDQYDDEIALMIERDGLRGVADRCIRSQRAYPVTHYDAVPCHIGEDRRLPAWVKDESVFEVDVSRVGNPMTAAVYLGIQHDQDEDRDALMAALTLNGHAPLSATNVDPDKWYPWRTPKVPRKTDRLYRFEFSAAGVKAGRNVIALKGIAGSSARLWSVELVLDPPLRNHVVDKVANLGKYEWINPHFRRVFDFLRRSDLKDLKPGRYEIDGKNSWVNIFDGTATPVEKTMVYEMHRDYIDIHMPLDGEETIGTVNTPDEDTLEPFREKEDCALFAAAGKPIVLKPFECGIFFAPGGAHAPWHTQKPQAHALRKVVAKVRAEFVPQPPLQQRRAEISWVRTICKEPNRYVGWPSVCRLKNGDILAVFSGDRDAHVCPWGKVQLVRSTDNGETWSEPETIANGPLDDRDAGIVQLPNGEIVVTYFTSLAYRIHLKRSPPSPDSPRMAWLKHDAKLQPETIARELGYFRMSSTDDGRTWTKPQKMKDVSHAPHGPSLMKDGSLLMLGRSFKDVKGDGTARGLNLNNRLTVISAWRSTDGARTWQCLCPEIQDEDGEYLKPNSFQEPYAIDLGDGHIVGLVRYEHDDHLLRETESFDGGKTWTKMRKTTMAGLPPHIVALADGKLVTVYGRRKMMPGMGEYATISDDGGKTWDTQSEVQLVPSDNIDLGYPASCVLPDGSILTVCYHRLPGARKTCLLGIKWRVK